MNSERLLKDHNGTIGMFRSVFTETVGRNYNDDRILSVESAEFLIKAHEEKGKNSWYFEHYEITQEEQNYFDEIMLDYLGSLRSWIRESAEPSDVDAGITTFFAQVFH
ncbi:hypothetical protein EHF33_00455 [Deinococcus psychrotolerans]|uniref:Uncharacterized protein n=1 Tax=Deinococcus psychrotolerans TaxID=2489213 RepID=A0A3G8Y8Y0_9DEIO|nr:hypothetical protein [Deinococcus psychrotolerans]AZI41410.1 hypothetical protein EHF33_00455 [Deinococcus psychrotolerans]